VSIHKKIFSMIFCLCLLGVMPSAVASLRTLIIDGGQIDGLPVAVVPFSVEGQDKSQIEDIATVIQNDLQTSGQFKVLSNQNIRQFPKSHIEVQYPYWQSLKIEDLVVGSVQKNGSLFTVSFELLDVLKQKSGEGKIPPLLSMRFDNIQAKDLRALAHHISDLIFQKIIGTQGIFSTRIAYVTVKETNQGLIRSLEVSDYDGYGPKTLFQSRYPLMSPNWSPDGKKIAFVSFEKERSSINTVEVSTGRIDRITQFPGLNSAPAWSPDGRKLAAVLSKDVGPKIYIIDLASKKLNQLTTGPGIDTEPFWASDGRSIVFTSDRGGKPQIYRVALNSGHVERLTFAGTYNAKPSLTPDGKNLITLHRNEEGLFNIALHNLTNGAVRVLTQTGLNDSPTLAPNGMMVLYGAQEAGEGILSAVTLDGRLKLRLPARAGSVQEPAWSPFNF